MSTETRNAEDVKTLGSELPKLMARVRDEILPQYLELGAVGAFGAMMIRRDLDMAAKSMAECDVAAMIAAYQTLKEIK